MGLASNKLPVLEEFVSVQGEGINVGVPYYFIRVGGCPLRCNFCDSEYSWTAKPEQVTDLELVIAKAVDNCKKYGIRWVSVTGGEPLLYPKQLLAMMAEFKANGLFTHIETSGRFYNKDVHQQSDLYSPDAKTPCTGEQMTGFFHGMEAMRDCDQVKCLISNDNDLNYAYRLNSLLNGRCTMVLQPFNTNIQTDNTSNMSQAMADSRVTGHIDIATIRNNLSSSLRWLLESYKLRCGQGDSWKRVIITPQIHVFAYGNKPGT